MNTQPIGILDSGIGGFSILRELIKKLPRESTIYVRDTANCPYGSKSPDEIHRLSTRLIRFLLERQCKLVVVACNTITVSVLSELRQDFPKIPFIGTVPAIKTAVSISKTKRIGILSTETTAKSQYLRDLISQFASGCVVINRGTDALVPLVEKGVLQGERITRALQKELKPFQDSKIDCLVLGCTHFSFLKPLMQQIVGRDVVILDSASAIARQTAKILKEKQLLSSEKHAELFYTTDDNGKFIAEGYSR